MRRGARELLQQAIEAELSTFMEGFESRHLDDGRAAVVRNGHMAHESKGTTLDYQDEEALPFTQIDIRLSDDVLGGEF
ncbi:hypothetical protein ACL7TT_19300 [Microbulbifer sp. 2304DJ12-6]|uniref:hypothetical protein n=1 Tax=Microbulbifer sp. 2304DJ12-6 TaxID=3233340 RepID=UPI0039B0ED54